MDSASQLSVRAASKPSPSGDETNRFARTFTAADPFAFGPHCSHGYRVADHPSATGDGHAR